MADARVLPRLDDVDWSALHHAYGPATDVPALLRAVISSDAAARDEAWSTLYGNVIHQGTVWQVTPHVVPFLLEMLAGPCPEPERVLRYLSALVEGRGDGTLEDDPELESPDAPPELARHAHAARRTRDEVLRGADAFRAPLTSSDARCRAETARLLAFLAPEVEALPALVDRLRVETDEVAQAALVWAMRLAARRSSRRELPIDEPPRAPSTLVRLVDALASLESGAPSAQSLDVIAAVLVDPTSVPRYEELPHRRFRVELDIARAVRASPPFPPGPVLPALVACMHALSDDAPFVASSVADAILHLVFEPIDWKALADTHAAPRPLDALSAVQRDVLSELARARGMWGTPGRRNGNLGALLRTRRLPGAWEELRDYLALADAP